MASRSSAAFVSFIITDLLVLSRWDVVLGSLPPKQNPASAHRQSRHMPEAGFPVLRVSYPTTHTLAARDLPLLCGSSSISNVTF